MSIANMTAEQRQDALNKARIARARQSEEWKANAHLLKQDFADAGHWARLASKHQIRMPGANVPGSELRFIRRAARKLGIEPQEIRNAFGGDFKHIHTMNPTWPAFAIIGLLLEMAEEKAIKDGD